MSIKGTWVFNETLTKDASWTDSLRYWIDFTYNDGSSDITFDNMYFHYDTDEFEFAQRYISSSYRYSFGNKEWSNLSTPVTITITGGDDITNETFISWLKANATRVTIVRKLKRLYLGDVVAKGKTKQLRKLTTVKPNADPYGIIGTWVFNDTLSYSYFIAYIDFVCNGTEYKRIDFPNYTSGKILEFNTQTAGGSYTSTSVYGIYSSSNKKWFSSTYKTITITDIDLTSPWYDEYFETFVTWLKANATKQPEEPEEPEEPTESIVGTWVFNSVVDTKSLNNSANIFINFTCNVNGVEYSFDSLARSSFSYASNHTYYLDYYSGSTKTEAYSRTWNANGTITNGNWTNGASYRTITITGGDDISKADFITWLKANATKQESIVGTWVFNDTIKMEPLPFNFKFEFYWVDSYNSIHNCYGLYSVAVSGLTSSDTLEYYGLPDSSLYVAYMDGAWIQSAYKTVTITSSQSTDASGNDNTSALLIWLRANAKRPGATTTITFTANDVTYQAEEGMTWAEWVSSDYNTSDIKVSTTSTSETFLYWGDTTTNCLCIGSTIVNSTDTIISGQAYTYSSRK